MLNLVERKETARGQKVNHIAMTKSLYSEKRVKCSDRIYEVCENRDISGSPYYRVRMQ